MSFYLKYYVDLSWVCSFCTCIVDVSFSDKCHNAYCQFKNSGILFIAKTKSNASSVGVCSVSNALLTFFI